MGPSRFVLQFVGSDGGERWERTCTYDSGEIAKIEGQLILLNQAALRPIGEMRLTVTRAEDGECLGTWVWSAKDVSWHPPAPR